MNWRRQIAVLALYGALTLLMTMPVVLNLTTHVAGQGGDPWQTMWRFEHEFSNAQRVMSNEGFSHWATSTFFGGGEPRLVNISVWLWMPLHILFGQPAAYNLVWLLSFILSGYVMYLLVRHLTLPSLRITHYSLLCEAPAFLAGLLYMFLPYHVAHAMGHFGAMQMQWLPLAILLLFLFVKRPTIWRTLGLAGAVALQSWSEHHYLLWLAIFGVVFMIFHIRASFTPGEEASSTPGVVPARGVVAGRAPYFVLLASLIFFFAVLPWVPTMKLALQPEDGGVLELGQKQTVRFSADLFSFITPPQWQPVWGGVAHEIFGGHFTGNVAEATQFLGWLPLLLIVFFRRSIPRPQRFFWLAVAAVFLLISLGPRLHVFGRVLPVPLPYALVDDWPVFGAVRAVARAGAMVGLSVSVLFGLVLALELKRPISAALVLGIILAEFLFLPVPLQEVKLSQAYAEIARLPGKAVVEIPAATNYTAASQALYASLRHGKEGIGNIALERALDREIFAEAKSLPALRQLLFLRTAHILGDRKEFFDQDLGETLPDVMEWLEAGAIAVRVDSLSAQQREAVDYFLETRMGWEGEKYEEVVLYRTRGNTPGEESDGVFLARDGQWENVGYDPARKSTFAEISREAAVTLYNVRAEPVRVELEFGIESGSVRVGEAVGKAGDVMRVPLRLAPGKKLITFENLLPGQAAIRDPKLVVE